MAPTTTRAWDATERLTPWVVFDLERVAWVVEQRAADLSKEERRVVGAAIRRMLDAITPGE